MIYLIRHGETAWSLTGQHTGLTDLHLTENGRNQAKALKPLLRDISQATVWCSPLIRARETCQLIGLSKQAEIVPELTEWNYGDYEGRTGAEIRQERPNWFIFTDGAPGGETPEQVYTRAQQVVTRVQQTQGHVVLVAHGHILRVVTACWLKQPIAFGKHLSLDTATLSILDYERQEPCIKLWNLSPNRSRS